MTQILVATKETDIDHDKTHTHTSQYTKKAKMIKDTKISLGVWHTPYKHF